MKRLGTQKSLRYLGYTLQVTTKGPLAKYGCILNSRSQARVFLFSPVDFWLLE